jgi:magnesium-transporting ATPase (P-type)
VVGGRVKTVNFDKTGTLTEDGMDLVGVYPVSNGVFYQGGLIEKDRKNDGDLK